MMTSKGISACLAFLFGLTKATGGAKLHAVANFQHVGFKILDKDLLIVDFVRNMDLPNDGFLNAFLYYI